MSPGHEVQRRTEMFYAVMNARADLNNGNRGFANTWNVARFETRAARDAFVAENGNRLARAATRKEAAEVWAAQYTCVGETVPVGGLFNAPYGQDRFEPGIACDGSTDYTVYWA